MSSKAKSKGTSWETKLLGLLKTIYPNAERASAGQPSRDFVNTGGIRIEAKKYDSPRFSTWVNAMWRAIPQGSPNRDHWAIMWSGDQRTHVSPLMVVPLPFGLELLEAYQQQKESKVNES